MTIGPASDDKGAQLETDLHHSLNNTTGFDYRGDNSKSGFDYRHDDQAMNSDDDSIGKNAGVELGYLPPDQRANMPGELLSHLVDPDIDDDTEAAEALRANAGVKVGKVGKVARSLNAQSVRKLAKRVTMRGNSGYRRGKPPRIPPGMTSDAAGDVFMYPLNEEGESMLDIGDDDAEDSDEHPRPRDTPLASNEEKQQALLAEIDPQFAPTVGPRKDALHNRDEGSHVSPSYDTDPLKKGNRHSSILDEAKDIPAEVVAATREAGRKCK